MSRPPAVILKSDEVKLGEPRPLPLPESGGTGKPARPARARVVQHAPDGVLVEVVCGCGQRIHLRCCHEAAGQSADGAAATDRQGPDGSAATEQ